jgi:hypothetical protein
MEMLIGRDDADPDDFLFHARTQLDLERFEQAMVPLEKHLETLKDPLDRVQALLLSAKRRGVEKARCGTKDGRYRTRAATRRGLNARSRVLAGDIEVARGEPEKAAKIYESVSVVIDEESVTPEALEKGVNAYRAGGLDADAKRLLNLLQSRYPEYAQRKKLL